MHNCTEYSLINGFDVAEIVIMDIYHSYCRTCMSNASGLMLNLFTTCFDSSNAADFISCTADIQAIHPSDNLPKQICEGCFKKLLDFHEYRKQIEVVDRKLRELFEYSSINSEGKDGQAICFQTEQDDIIIINDNDEHGYDELMLDIYKKVENKNPKLEPCVDTYTGKQKINIEKSDTKYVCDVCQQEFNNRDRIEKHMAVHAPTSEIKIKKGTEVEIEIKEETELMCDKCPSIYDTQQALAAHKRTHTKPKRVLPCSICGKIIKCHLKRHELSHKENRPYKCHTCPKTFLTEENLKDHLNKHKKCCPICSKEFANQATLTGHMNSHTGVIKPHLCQTCGKKFKTSNKLKQHMRRHVGEKPFSCDMCPKKFFTRSEFKSHYTTHTGERKWSCDDCGALFTKSMTLTKHKLTHVGIKPHKCNICSKKFVRKDHLTRHYLIHTGEKPYKCDICECSFTQSSNLLKHKQSHIGSNVYKCDQCPERFRLKSELTHHLSDHYVDSLKKNHKRR